MEMPFRETKDSVGIFNSKYVFVLGILYYQIKVHLVQNKPNNL